MICFKICHWSWSYSYAR